MALNYDTLYQFILDNKLLSEAEVTIIQTCVNDIKELSPSEVPLIFKRIEKLVNDAENLSWCIYSVSLVYDKLVKANKKIQDPEYVVLARQGLPSEAIHSTIRWKHEEIYDTEELISNVEHLIEYLKHLEKSLERYRYMLIDKVKTGDD